MIELQSDAVGIFEQQRIISRRPLILARRANDRHTVRTQEAVQFVNVGALAGAKTQMVQADAVLLERSAGVLGLLAARARALITAVFAAAAGALLIVDQLHLGDVLHAKIAASQGSSATGVLGIASLFNVNPGIGLVVALAILVLAVLYNLAALIVTPASEPVLTPEPPHPPPTLSTPP